MKQANFWHGVSSIHTLVGPATFWRRFRFDRLIRTATLLAALISLPSGAEICWDYTDLTDAKVPLKCVEMGDGVTPCSWNASCNTDLDASDCCMTVPDPAATQTIGEMHQAWHQCLGDVGTSASPPPPNRGLRWYAFHRQFESDFNVYRESVGIDKIDSLEWCPGMTMPYGHFGGGLAFGDHPNNCGTGMNRPNNITCDGCETFNECLYVDGAGPGACTTPATAGCARGGVSFPYTRLQDFENVDEIATLLDAYYHGDMHGAVADADGGGYVADAGNPNCSTRDGMFWRLHKSLDDVVRAWQDMQAVDVTLVIDRSGSMDDPSGTGVGSRLDNAKEAADMFADLLEDGRSDGGTNRLGIVSYASTAANAALNLPLQDVDATLRDAGGPFATTLGSLSAGGATSIGAGLEAAVNQLCPGGSCATHMPASGENERKAMLLLTDGRENRAPCLEAGCESGGGAEIDYASLDVTQLCTVGLGNAASINGDLLTILSERQGGIYLNNTDTTGNDLKDFFAKCFAQLTDEFIGLDPKGVIALDDPAGPIVPYESCDDNRITFTSGWNSSTSSLPGDKLHFLVNSPNGDAWVPSAVDGEMSSERTWAFKRSPLPYRKQAEGTWTMQLLRPQRAFANGFTSDSFVDEKQGVRIVRRQIQRLCPINDDGAMQCERVLFFEDGTQGPSAYAGALKAEIDMTVGKIAEIQDPGELEERLKKEQWDLIVYARQAGSDDKEPYDDVLASAICDGTPAIVTDTRSVKGAAEILQCAGAIRDDETVELNHLVGNEDFLSEDAELHNPGYAVYSYGLIPVDREASTARYAALFEAPGKREKRSTGAIVAVAQTGSELQWHKNVLVTGLSQLTAFAPRSAPLTGQTLKAGVRILPSFLRKGGYPGGKMTVEVERPTRGLGALVKYTKGSEESRGDPVSALEREVGSIQIPTKSEMYTLNDEGEKGDVHPRNGTYSADLPISAAVDGMYTFHYRFEYPVGNCVARREFKHSLFVEVQVDPHHSEVEVGNPEKSKAAQVYPVRIRPQDALGNVVGPGRSPRPSCALPCHCDSKSVVDEQDGSYTVKLNVPRASELSACGIDAFGAHFDLGDQRYLATLEKPAIDVSKHRDDKSLASSPGARPAQGK